MPDKRKHRGPHPEDAELFAADRLPSLRAATRELSWLYSRGYKPVSSLKLVGDRHALTERQRSAVARCACTDEALQTRRAHRCEPQEARGESVWIDAFNVLTTLEVALSGGVVLIGRDGMMRDIAGVHGSYRKVSETIPAIDLIARETAELGIADCRLYLDRPVSNSGRLKTMLLERARAANLLWQAELVPDPDPLLAESPHIVITADGPVLDRAKRTLNLTRLCIESAVPGAFVIDLSEA